MAGDLPYFFQCLNYSNHYQMPVFAETRGGSWASRPPRSATSTTCTASSIRPRRRSSSPTAGIEIMSNDGHPGGHQGRLEHRQEVGRREARTSSARSSTRREHPALQTLMQLDYNPKAFLGGPGGSTQAIYDIFAGAADRCIFEGAWTYETEPRGQGLLRQARRLRGRPAERRLLGPADLPGPSWSSSSRPSSRPARWTTTRSPKSCGTAHFKTLMSDDIFFTNQILDRSCYAGQIGQWQNGFPQIIDPGAKRTAAPIWYPKPTWTEAPAMPR